MLRTVLALVLGCALVGACSKKEAAAPSPAAAGTGAGTGVATAPPSAAAPAAPAPAATGFDVAAAPTGRAPDGPFPYFGLLDGYEKATPSTSPTSAAVKFFTNTPFDAYEMFDGTKVVTVQGHLFQHLAVGKGASFLMASKTYEKLTHDLGGVTVFEGAGKDMQDHKVKFIGPRFRFGYNADEDRMAVYLLKTPASQIWVEVYHPGEDRSENYWLSMIETKPLEAKVQAIPADEMKRKLDAEGKVAVYINFDTDKTTLKPDAQAAVAQMVKLIADNPDLKLEVQGHTDNVGGAAHNQTLSDGRAAAVVAALTGQGVAAGRLTAKGYGQSRPVADNGAEDGRAKNRRVELVKR